MLVRVPYVWAVWETQCLCLCRSTVLQMVRCGSPIYTSVLLYWKCFTVHVSIRVQSIKYNSYRLFLSFFFMAAYGSFPARDWIQAAAVNLWCTLANPDGLGWGLNVHLKSNWSCCSWILNPLCHGGNSQYWLFSYKRFNSLNLLTSNRRMEDSKVSGVV